MFPDQRIHTVLVPKGLTVSRKSILARNGKVIQERRKLGGMTITYQDDNRLLLVACAWIHMGQLQFDKMCMSSPGFCL